MPKALLSSALLALLAAVPLTACDDDDVGIQCEGGSGGGDDTGGFVITESLQCRSRLCIEDTASVNPIPRCTRVCSDNGDCPDEGPNCAEGFLCRVGTTVNIVGVQCCKLCICKDDLSQAEREQDKGAKTCNDRNIEAKCPNL